MEQLSLPIRQLSHQLNRFMGFRENDPIPGREAESQGMPILGGLTVPETPCRFSDSGRLDDSGWTGRRRARSKERLIGHENLAQPSPHSALYALIPTVSVAAKP